MNNEFKPLCEFGKCRLDVEKKFLWCNDHPVRLPLKAIELLCVLVEKGGAVVTKDEIWQAVWQNSFVEETNLTHNIYLLRKSFKELGEPDLIQTVPRRGYRFTGEIREIKNETDKDEIIIEHHTVSQTLVEDISDQNEFEPRRSRNPKIENRLSQNSVESHRPRIFVSLIIIVAICALLIGFGSWQYFRSKRNSNTVSLPELSTRYTSFAEDGKVLTDFGFPVERAETAVIQPDGKIIVGGWVGENLATTDFAVARYNPDGSLDTTFDSDGKVITPLGDYVDQLYGLTIQPDGKILAVGAYSIGKNSRKFCVVRYKSNGALDAGFDEDGIVALEIGMGLQDTAYAAAVLPDGKILVVGSALMIHNAGKLQMGQNDFAVVRLNGDGSLDTSFGENGKIITDSGSGSDVAYALALQPNGKIVVGGMMAGGRNQDFGLARYQADGTPDSEFGAGGKVRTEFFDENNIIWSLALQPDGKIVAGGYAVKAGNPAFAVARYAEDGSLDNSFNGNGKLTIDVDGGGVGREVFVQPDGRIFIGGRSGLGTETGFGFARVFADGRLDESFGDAGKISISFQIPVEAHGMVLTSDAYAVSVGSAGDNKSSDFAIARVSLFPTIR